jgi:hypothetical protein
MTTNFLAKCALIALPLLALGGCAIDVDRDRTGYLYDRGNYDGYYRTGYRPGYRVYAPARVYQPRVYRDDFYRDRAVVRPGGTRIYVHD